MSKFIDQLNRVSQVESQTMGFKAAKAVSPKPKIQLVASLAQAEVSDVADYVAGADTGLLPVSGFTSGAKTIQEISKAVSGIPWGGWLRDGGRGGMKQLVKAGCDFVVFPAADTSLTILQGDEVGKILQVDASLSEGLLRAINELPVDAVFVAGEQEEGHLLTWHHLMLFRRFASLLTKPLLVSVLSNVTTEELQALWDGGVGGVVVDVGAGQPTGVLKELRQAIDKLVLPSSRKQDKTGVLLHHIGREKDAAAEEDEDV
jgi:hypothetical protein